MNKNTVQKSLTKPLLCLIFLSCFLLQPAYYHGDVNGRNSTPLINKPWVGEDSVEVSVVGILYTMAHGQYDIVVVVTVVVDIIYCPK